MKEIRFSKIYCISMLVVDICMLALGCFLIVYYIHSLRIAKDTRVMLKEFILLVFFLLIVKSAFIDVVFNVRFYGMRVKLLDDKMILSINNKECQIPTGKDTNVINCMFGWLIIWLTGDKRNMMLLRKMFFLGRTCRPELRKYLELNMNYISSKEEKKKLLASFHVNVLNPLKYIQWPASCVNSKREL